MENTMFPKERRRPAKLPLLVQDHVVGSTLAPVIIVEYGTYCCPRDIRIYSDILAIQDACPNQVAFVYRHFPLVTTYPSAFLAAEAAEAAAAQGNFWLMHGYLVGHPRPYSIADLATVAEELGLDGEVLTLDLQEHTHAARVTEHFHSGVRSGVRHLPALFVNGQLYEGNFSLESMRRMVLPWLHDAPN
jgi:protein-disulfide isomerase